MAYHPRRCGRRSPFGPRSPVPAHSEPVPSEHAERILPLPPAGEGRGEGAEAKRRPGFNTIVTREPLTFGERNGAQWATTWKISPKPLR